MRKLSWLLIAAVGIYLAAIAVMYGMQRQLQYFPAHSGRTALDTGLRDAQVIALPTADGETVVMWYQPARAGKPTVLFFQGNAGEIADRADRFAHYTAQGFGAAFLSYRGYGDSTGDISEAGLILDATTAYDWLHTQSVDRIVVVGESLGTGVAVQLAALRRADAVALEAPYTSTADVAARRFGWLPVRWLMKDQFPSIDHIAAINAPLLIQHGDADRVIPFDLGQRLFDAAKEPKSFQRLGGMGHEALFAPETWAREMAFFDQLPQN